MALRRSLIALAGPALVATSITLASPASAHIVAPNDNGGGAVPAPPPDIVSNSGLPTWAVVLIVAGTMLIALATTLITLAVVGRRYAYPAMAAQPTDGPETIDLDPAAETLQHL